MNNNNDPGSSITTAFQYLYQNHRYTDFTLISKDKEEQHRVHKLVLSIFSSELSNIVQVSDSYHVDTVNNRALQNMVKFFYDLPLIIDNINDIRSTKTIADKFEIAELANICKEKFSNLTVTVSDVLAILETARDFNNDAKVRECIQLIGENQNVVLASESFKKLQYQRAVDILKELKNMNIITESKFVYYGVTWLETNDIIDKKDLKEKINLSNISLDEFLNLIVSFPTFFTNVEISNAVKEKWHEQLPVQDKSENVSNNLEQSKDSTANAGRNASNSKQFADATTNTETNVTDSKCFQNVGTSIEKSLLTQYTKEVGTNIEKSIFILINGTKENSTNTEKDAVQESFASNQKDQVKQKQMIIQIMNKEDGVNVYKAPKRVKFTLKDYNSTRSLQATYDDVLKKGLLGKVLEKRKLYQVTDVNVSYEGIYNMIRMLQDIDDDLKPTEFIEVLKAAEYFELDELRSKCIVEISKIIDNDPLFLDGLNFFPQYFEDQCLAILLQNPLSIIMHPNFIHCSAGFIFLLLQQNELKIKDETQLLLVVISWLEASVKERVAFRSSLLENLAFESISTKDFKYAVSTHANFFDKKEVEVILAYRNAVGEEEMHFRDRLPPWYTFKSRILL